MAQRVKIDESKIKEALEITGLNKADFCRKIGRDPSFLNNYIGNGKSKMSEMGMNDVLFIKNVTGIDVTYVEPIKGEERSAFNENVPKGQEDTYLAVYYAVTDALKELLLNKGISLTNNGKGIIKDK